MTPRARGPRRQVTPSMFPEGVVGDRYALGDVLGVGGTGTVFRAKDAQTGEEVAVKAIPRDGRLERRARRELRVARHLDHPGIVPLLDVAEDGDYQYLVYELVRGEDLTRIVREGALDDPGILRVAAAVCDALAHAHAEGVVHRDVKPGNVLLGEDGIARLTDFGIALVDHPDATIDDRLLGTLSYMSPEQAANRDVDGKTDVWAAALMVYEALTGDNPYRARTPQGLAAVHAGPRLPLSGARPDLPGALCRVVERGLDALPARRPDAAQLRDALLSAARAIETGEPGALEIDLPAPGIDVAERVRRLRRGLRRVARREPRTALRVVDPAAPPPLAARLRAQAEAAGGLLVRASGAGLDAPRLPGGLPLADLSTLRRLAPGLVTGGTTLPLLGALPFYPTAWPIVLAAVLGALALVRPYVAAAALALLVLPLAGNVTAALVGPLVLGAALWLAAVRGDGRRALEPALATPLAFAAWPLYPLLAARGRRPHVRAALGAAGPVAVAIASGLAGWTSPLTGIAHGAGLAALLPNVHDPLLAGELLLRALGPAVLLQAAVWGVLAVGARPLLEGRGASARWHAAIWLAAGYAGTVLAPLVVGVVVPTTAATVGVAVAGILLLARSAMAPASADGPA